MKQPCYTSKTRAPLSLLVTFFCLTLWSSISISDTDVLPFATNLQSLGQQAKKDNLPIAILFSAQGLKSTQNLKDEALLPALYSGELDGYVHMREINVNLDQTTVDFYGETIQNKEFKAFYNLTSLPAVVFVNSDGDVIEEQLLSGAYDFYFHYLKASINQALIALDNPKQIP